MFPDSSFNQLYIIVIILFVLFLTGGMAIYIFSQLNGERSATESTMLGLGSSDNDTFWDEDEDENDDMSITMGPFDNPDNPFDDPFDPTDDYDYDPFDDDDF
ncbi:MAG: hypothetical protein ACTSYD_06990 [Candidatus Heimdallarchaeaceae archaeon]